MDVLVLGRRQEVADKIVTELANHGVRAVASTEVDKAEDLIDARDYGLIVFGSGVAEARNAELREHFRSQNPNVRLATSFAPIAVRQILGLLRQKGEPSLTDVSLDDDLVLRGKLRAAGELRVEVYRVPTAEGFAVDILREGPATAGEFEIALDDSYRSEGFMAVLSINDEYHLYPLPGREQV